MFFMTLHGLKESSTGPSIQLCSDQEFQRFIKPLSMDTAAEVYGLNSEGVFISKWLHQEVLLH